MKIKKNILKTKQLLMLQLIKSRVYDNTYKNNSLDSLPIIDMHSLIIKLKKVVNILFEYHKNKKKILFIGIPKIIETKINNETNHVAIPKFYNILGLFINKSILKSLRLKHQILKNNNKLSFTKLLNKPDIIVIIDSDQTESIIKESSRAKIPVIVFNSNSGLKKKLCYDVPSNFNFTKKTTNDLFFKIINSILK